jgi:uncharacterized protein (DUF488 family)
MARSKRSVLRRDSRSLTVCSESLWWGCHRRLVADQLVERGDHVVHIGPDGRATEHERTPFAVVDGERVTYPPSGSPAARVTA